MMDHLDVLNRLAQTHARQAFSEDRRRPKPLLLVPAIMHAAEGEPRTIQQSDPIGRIPWRSHFRFVGCIP